MRRYAILFVWLMIIIGLLIWVTSCATLKTDITLPDGTRIKAESATLLKDLRFDPNDGAISVVSPQTPGILDVLLSGLAGLAIGLGL